MLGQKSDPKQIVLQFLQVFGQFLYLGCKWLFRKLLGSVDDILIVEDRRFISEAGGDQGKGKVQDRPNLHSARTMAAVVSGRQTAKEARG